MCAAVLGLEAVVLGLTTPIMVVIAGVGLATALAVGLGLALACVLVAGMLRREWAYLVGWAIQVAAVALGFVVPLMFFLGAVFGALWATADLLGQRIERERAAAFADFDRQHGPDGASSSDPQR